MPSAHLTKPTEKNPTKAVVLLVTHDRDLIERMIETYTPNLAAIDYLDHFSQVNGRLQMPGGVQALVVDISGLRQRELLALRALMLASPNLPVLVIGNDDDSAIQAKLLAEGAQDFLLKRTVNGNVLDRAAQNAVARKLREMEAFDEYERARATLASIGDGVLCTDSGWLVTYMNPVAERLTGWSCVEATGHHVSEVFRVLHGVTRVPTTPKIEIAVGAGNSIILPPSCVLVRRDGQELPIEDSAAPIHAFGGQFAGMVVVFHDVSLSRALAQDMSHLSDLDELTVLPSGALLSDRMERGIALSRRHSRLMAILLIDIDHFKGINDTLGHLAGDHILKVVAQRIINCVRQSDTVSRHAGDQFIVLLSEVHRPEDAAVSAEKIRLALMEPYIVDVHCWHLTASVGISVYPDDGDSGFELTRHAETAAHHAKLRGRNNSQFFKNHINVRADERTIITADLRHALERGEFFLVFQPKINLLTGKVAGFEALIRWHHPTRKTLYPATFIPLAEECGLIIPIGEWVLLEACARARSWLDAGLRFETMAVNISAVEFRSDSLFDGICRILGETGLNPRFLEIEITETAVMRDFEAASIVLRHLSAMGVRVAVDDFGTGYNNLSYLKRFPINTLKLDRSFIHDLPDSADLGIIVSSVIRMAHGLRLSVVGEGVETPQQLEFLTAHKCEEAQGFYFSRPLEADQCPSFLLQKKAHWHDQLASQALRPQE